MRLVLHIGTEKTATTYLQSWLYTNKSELSKQGVYLSELLETPNNRKLAAYFQPVEDDYYRANGLRSKKAKAKFFSGFVEAFQAEIQNASKTHHTMIISSEHFHSRFPRRAEIAQLAEFLKPMFSDIDVICYFREQSALRLSLYSTFARGEGATSVNAFDAQHGSESDYYNHYRVATRWSSEFGKAHFHARIFDSSWLKEGDIRADFLSVAGARIKQQKLSFDTPRLNESLGAECCVVFAAINEMIPRWRPNGSVRQENLDLKQWVTSLNVFSSLGFTDIDDQFRRRFDASNARFFKEFVDGVNAFPERKMTPTLSEDDAKKNALAALEGACVAYTKELMTTLEKGLSFIKLNGVYDGFSQQLIECLEAHYYQCVKQFSHKYDEVILHIGMHKTGSSAVQIALEGYDDGEVRYGGLRDPNHSQLMVTRFSDSFSDYHAWKKLGLSSEQAVLYKNRTWVELEKDLGRTSARKVIYSAEDFGLMSQSAKARLLDRLALQTANVRIIMYVREPLGFASAAFSEYVRSGTVDFEPKRLKPLYLARLEGWSHHDLEVSLQLYNFHQLIESDAVIDFAERLELDRSKVAPIKINESLSAPVLKILWRINSLLSKSFRGPARFRARQALIKQLMSKYAEPKVDLAMYARFSDASELDELKEQYNFFVDHQSTSSRIVTKDQFIEWLGDLSDVDLSLLRGDKSDETLCVDALLLQCYCSLLENEAWLLFDRSSKP